MLCSPVRLSGKLAQVQARDGPSGGKATFADTNNLVRAGAAAAHEAEEQRFAREAWTKVKAERAEVEHKPRRSGPRWSTSQSGAGRGGAQAKAERAEAEHKPRLQAKAERTEAGDKPRRVTSQNGVG